MTTHPCRCVCKLGGLSTAEKMLRRLLRVARVASASVSLPLEPSPLRAGKKPVPPTAEERAAGAVWISPLLCMSCLIPPWSCGCAHALIPALLGPLCGWLYKKLLVTPTKVSKRSCLIVTCVHTACMRMLACLTAGTLSASMHSSQDS